MKECGNCQKLQECIKKNTIPNNGLYYCCDYQRPNPYSLIEKQNRLLLEALITLKKQVEELITANTNKHRKINELTTQLQPFQDPYFKGLSMETIAELAKKSIRITKDSRELLDGLEKFLKFRRMVDKGRKM